MFTHAEAVFLEQEKRENGKNLKVFNPVFLESHGIALLEKIVNQKNIERLKEVKK